MCGIYGSVNFNKSENITALKRIVHRGPDNEGYYEYNNAFLGHQRLSIIDTSAAGNQPMFSGDNNYVLIFNGEIYNYTEIKQELIKKGYHFASSSDTETLLYGYIEYGEKIVNKLNGIFAFAILNKATNELFIARDHFGVKPLYYYRTGNQFAFGSELKSLTVLPGFNKEIETAALFSYLQLLYSPGELTPFKAVKKLLPGHYMKCQLATGSVEIHKYYSLTFNESLGDYSEQELINKTEEKLIKAVERQLMSDVPVGFFFSGGLDSTLIAAIATKVLGKNLPCYTIDTGTELASEGVPDDLSFAKKAADWLGVDLRIVKADTDVLRFFDKVVWYLDEPQADAAPINVLNICTQARSEGVKVLLGGTAGDDIFTGYRRHQAANYEKYLSRIPKGIPVLANSLLSAFSVERPFVRRTKKMLAQISKSRQERFAGYFSWMSDEEVFNLFDAKWHPHLKKSVLPQEFLVNRLSDVEKANNINQMLFLEFQGFLPDHNLNYTDKLSMAVGVETRVPYLDTELVEFAASLPVQMKLRGRETKYILKKIAEKYLPHEVIYRPKTGFGAPVRRWIKEDMSDMIKSRLSRERVNQRGIFSYEAVASLIERNNSGAVDASYTIWALLSIESWFEQFTGR